MMYIYIYIYIYIYYIVPERYNKKGKGKRGRGRKIERDVSIYTCPLFFGESNLSVSSFFFNFPKKGI